ncbi:MAG: SUMF1/EgtB/PvdO family nonheme iron enzyme [Myxococcales bacterium]|nr:SUMF1/EgtB/PvdO family nonheme iron enzyme [Myxococcales bacterium]
MRSPNANDRRRSQAGAAQVRPLGAALVVGLLGLPSFLVPEVAQGGRGACPSGMAHVPGVSGQLGFCIDKWEASLVEVDPRGRRTPHSPYELVKKGARVAAVSRPGIVPQAHISRNEAEAACAAAGKRLCAEDEWTRACEGRHPTRFPYGNDRHDGYCNDHGRAPLSVVFPSDGAAVYASSDKMNDPRLNQVPGSISKTGAHPRCKNAYGVFDMVGNLHEWVADPSGTFRGGYYLDTHKNGDGCRYRTSAHDATYRDYSTGFRCCADGR